MFIEFLAPSPKAGIKEHVSRETGAALVAAGFAKPAPIPDSDIRLHKDSVQAPYVAEPLWTVFKHSYSGEILVCLKRGFETTFFDGPPDPAKFPGCPASIAEQFALLKGRSAAEAKATAAVYQKALRERHSQ
jgi:hypothetical protein